MPENAMSEEQFHRLYELLGGPKDIAEGFIYQCYLDAMDSKQALIEGGGAALAALPINPAQLTLYLINEHRFFLETHPEKKEEDLIEDENYETFLVGIALDKYFTNEHLAYKNRNFSNRFSPEISTIALYLNFILGMLERYQKGSPNETLLPDVLRKGFSMAQCIVTLITSGFETEAFSTWRTLHENECILMVLVRYGKPVIDAYVRHLKYAICFRSGMGSKEETDKVFEEIKSGMRENGLKSKDMKRFIEYGWLSAIPEVKEGKVPDFKFNFRDGVERMAELRDYSSVYEMSSEIAHSSPLLIYSRRDYYYFVTMLNLYESFFRLERVFSTLYIGSVPPAERERYRQMWALYHGELESCRKSLQARFAAFMKADRKTA